MPILTCPTCGSKLEVIDDDIGHLVQCGSCQGTFTAEDPAAKKNDGASRKPYAFKDKDDEDDDRPRKRGKWDDEGEDDRPSRRRRDDDDEDDDPDGRYRRRSRPRGRDRDDDAEYERRYGQAAPQTGMGIASMCLGIVSIPTTFCYGIGIPCAVLGIIFGILALKTAGRGMGIAGIITSVLSFLLFGAVVLYVVVMIMATAPGGGGGGGAGGGF